MQKEVEMIDVHQNVGFVKMFLRRRSSVIDNRCKPSSSNSLVKEIEICLKSALIMATHHV